MHENLADVSALDRDGRELTWAHLASVVIGPLGAQTREADTTAALLEAVTPHTTTPEHIYADLLAEQSHGPEGVVSEHETLGQRSAALRLPGRGPHPVKRGWKGP